MYLGPLLPYLMYTQAHNPTIAYDIEYRFSPTDITGVKKTLNLKKTALV